MHITLPRNKKRNWILSLIYRLYKLTRAFVPSTKLLPTLLDLEWIFSRLAHEESFRFYNKENHPILKNTVDYIKSKLPKGAVVLDLGCGHGDVSYAIAKAGYEVVGIDHSLSSISDAKNNYHLSNLRFENQDAVTYLEQNKKNLTCLYSHMC